MICSNPTLVYYDQNEPTKRLFRNWDLASRYAKLTGLPLDCGKCIHCRKKKALELARRCVLHASMYQNNCFVTLTYDESHVGDNTIDYSHIQKFKKSLRRHCEPKKIEIFNVHEYGKNGRKHWHLVIFNHQFSDRELFSQNSGVPIFTSNQLRRLWTHGHHTIGNVSEASAMYQAQYTQKDIVNGNENNNRRSKSVHSGIGKPFFNAHYRQILSLGYIPFGNQKMPIPRYFEKLAHKHYCHFYEKSAFFDTMHRKQLYRPFKEGEENYEIAELYKKYLLKKQERISNLKLEWQQTLEEWKTNEIKPDFVKSGENTLYELKRKKLLLKETF